MNPCSEIWLEDQAYNGTIYSQDSYYVGTYDPETGRRTSNTTNLGMAPAEMWEDLYTDTRGYLL